MSSSPLCIPLKRHKIAQKWCLTKRTCCLCNACLFSNVLPSHFAIQHAVQYTMTSSCDLSHDDYSSMNFSSSPVYFLSYPIFHPYFRDLHPFHARLHHWFSILTQPLSFLILLLGAFLSFTFLSFVLSVPCTLGQIAKAIFRPARNWSCLHGLSTCAVPI